MKKLLLFGLLVLCLSTYSQRRFKDGLVIEDSVYLLYLLDDGQEYQWLGLTPTGSIYADSLSNASFMLKMDLPNYLMGEYLQDTVKGEIRWYYKDTLGKISFTYDLSTLSLGKQVQSIMASSEMDKRYIAKIENKINLLIIGFIMNCILIMAILIYMTFKK